MPMKKMKHDKNARAGALSDARGEEGARLLDLGVQGLLVHVHEEEEEVGAVAVRVMLQLLAQGPVALRLLERSLPRQRDARALAGALEVPIEPLYRLHVCVCVCVSKKEIRVMPMFFSEVLSGRDSKRSHNSSTAAARRASDQNIDAREVTERRIQKPQHSSSLLSPQRKSQK